MRVGQNEASKLPDADFVRQLTTKVLGVRATKARQFLTGLRHFVFEVEFEERPSVVMRLASGDNRAKIADAVRLSKLLRPLGIPLPALIAADTIGPYPYMVLERLAGVDLGQAMNQLSEAALDTIAARVVAAQKVVAGLPAAGRFGYAALAEEAPFPAWSHVLDDGLNGARARLQSARLFDVSVVDRVAACIEKDRHLIDAMNATPFLHDTTTKNVIVTEEGAFSGIVDVDSLCWGDPRFAASLTMASILFHEGPVSYVQAWMRYAEAQMDKVFWLYVAQSLVTFMSEYGQTFRGEELKLDDATKRRLLEAFEAAIGQA